METATLWLADLADHSSDSCWTDLTAQERIQAGRFREEGDRHRFVVRRSLRHRVISGFAGRPAEITTACLVCGHPTHGKPHIDKSDVHFSSSSAATRCGLVVAQQEIGLDIEHRDRLALLSDGSVSPETWPVFESIVKCAGVGLAVDPSHVRFTWTAIHKVTVEVANVTPVSHLVTGDWFVRVLLDLDYIAAIATREPVAVDVCQWTGAGM